MSTNSYSIEIDASPEHVFYWFDDNERVMQWLPNLVENENVRVTADKVGSTFRQVYLERGRRMEMHGTVTRYEPNKRLTYDIRSEMFDLLVDYRFDDLGGRTRLTEEYTTQFNGRIMKIMGALMSPFMKKASLKQLEESFAKLKQLAESRHPANSRHPAESPGSAESSGSAVDHA